MKLTELFARQTTPQDAGDDVQALLNELGRVGKPRLCQSDGGWHCSVEINIKSAGTRFEITSGFGFGSATDALTECLNRLRKVQQSLHIQTTIESQLQREWQRLTDAELDDIYGYYHDGWSDIEETLWGYERAIEAKLKEKNGG